MITETQQVVVVVQTIGNSMCLSRVEPACILIQAARAHVINQPLGEEKGRVANVPHPLVAPTVEG